VTRNSSGKISGDIEVGALRSFIMSPLNIVLNIFIVYHLKRNFAFANEGLFGGLPIRFILSVGFVTVLLIFPVQAVFDFYEFRRELGKYGGYLHVVVYDLPLLLYIWTTGAMTALLVQDSIWKEFVSEGAKRVMDGIAYGASMLFSIAALFAIDAVFPIPMLAKMPPLGSFESIFGIFVFSFISFFILGFLLMVGVRKATSLRFVRDGMIASAALVRG
jgi:hypothetical protein